MQPLCLAWPLPLLDGRGEKLETVSRKRWMTRETITLEPVRLGNAFVTFETRVSGTRFRL